MAIDRNHPRHRPQASARQLVERLQQDLAELVGTVAADGSTNVVITGTINQRLEDIKKQLPAD